MLSVRDRISHGRAGNAIVFASPDVFLKPSEGVLRFSRPDFISSSVCACMRDAGKKGEGGGATSRKSNGRGTEVSESGRRAIGGDAQLEIHNRRGKCNRGRVMLTYYIFFLTAAEAGGGFHRVIQICLAKNNSLKTPTTQVAKIVSIAHCIWVAFNNQPVPNVMICRSLSVCSPFSHPYKKVGLTKRTRKKPRTVFVCVLRRIVLT